MQDPFLDTSDGCAVPPGWSASSRGVARPTPACLWSSRAIHRSAAAGSHAGRTPLAPFKVIGRSLTATDLSAEIDHRGAMHPRSRPAGLTAPRHLSIARHRPVERRTVTRLPLVTAVDESPHRRRVTSAGRPVTESSNSYVT